MLPAEKWYEHQTKYQKYGLAMRPTAAGPARDIAADDGVSARDRARLVLLTIFAGLLGIALIIAAAYAAQVQYSINDLLAESDVVQGEIENLNVAIKSASCITAIEEKAMGTLGMVYPSSSQIAYISPSGNEEADFAEALRAVAFRE